jgi:hypothetical protein
VCSSLNIPVLVERCSGEFLGELARIVRVIWGGLETLWLRNLGLEGIVREKRGVRKTCKQCYWAIFRVVRPAGSESLTRS